MAPRKKQSPSPETPQAPETPVTQTPDTKTTRIRSTRCERVSSERFAQLVQELNGKESNQETLMIQAGYCSERKDPETGETEVVITKTDTDQFLSALIALQGLSFTRPKRAYRTSNRANVVSLSKGGQVVIGPRYTEAAGFPFGEGVETKLTVTATANQILLTLALPDPSDSPDPGGYDPEGDSDEESDELDD